MDRSARMFRSCVAAVFLVTALPFGAPPRALETSAGFDPAIRPQFREPVMLSSKDGVLEVRLTAKQGEARLDTVAVPVKNFLLYGYELIRGVASNGETASAGSYPAPTLKVDPGETLIIHYDNALTGLTIEDFFDPQYTPKGEPIPLYPPQLSASPLNLHTHGIHVSPKGNADNVMLHIPPGYSNTFTYKIPKSMPQGAYWYHPHLHTLTAPHVYLGLAGLLAIGRTDGNIPLVTEKQIPIRNMVLQYNYVFERASGLAQLNNYNWPMWVNSLEPPKDGELAKGAYRPLLTPVNFLESKQGTQYSTIWYSGPLSIRNERGRFEFIPANLQRFTPFKASDGEPVPADPALPDWQRDVQFTVNGQFQPVIPSKAGQTEIWVLANVSDIVYMPVQLTETASGRAQKIAIVGQDGVPYTKVHAPIFENGTRLLIPPATRYAIAVTMPEKGELVLEMPPRGGGASTINAPGILYTNNGTENPPAILGSLSVLPEAVSYYDGFFVSPTQVLARATTFGGKGLTTAFEEGQELGAYTVFEDISKVEPDFTRDLLISGGFLNSLADNNDPKAFTYVFEGIEFPYAPLLQPRLGSIEEWRFLNDNNDEHPIHIHVNDFQVTYYLDPTRGIETGPEMWAVDNANVPAPNLGPEESVIQRGALNLRMKFDDFAGLFVMHCHRLNHEDNGLMMLVNVIPAASTFAVAVPGKPAQVRIYDAKDNSVVAAVTPFPGFDGTPSLAMGDLDADGVYDLVAGAGEGHAPEVVAYAGKDKFKTELARFLAFDGGAKGGVSVASSQIDGTAADNIIVGSGPGAPSEVKVFRSDLPETPGTAPSLFATFTPYADDRSGVSVASGFVDFSTGRYSIVTAPGKGTPAQVKVFNFSLMTPIGETRKDANDDDQCLAKAGKPQVTASFMPFGIDYRGGLSLATGWLAGELGGAQRIVVGQLEGDKVKVYSSGSRLDGGPPMYLAPADHPPVAGFGEMASFVPFEGASQVRVATTSTTTGADLLVSGVVGGKAAQVAKYSLVRQRPDAAALEARRLGGVASIDGAKALAVGGD